MEKTFIYGTLFFSWIITIALFIFAIFACKYASLIIAIILVVLTILSISVNIMLLRKWKQDNRLGK